MRGPLVGVIGAGECSAAIEALAEEVGRELARCGAVLVCGGRGGVMTAAARGAKALGGPTVGILPGPSTRDANPYIDFPIATNLGQARNAVIVHTVSVLIAIAGGYGTLSEVALALKIGKSVVALVPGIPVPGVHLVEQPKEAVARALALIGREPSHPPLS